MKYRPGKFFWKLFFGHALLLVGVVGTCVWLTLGALDRFFARELSGDLRSRAEFLRLQLEDRLDDAHAAELDQLAKSIAGTGADRVRITLVLADGTVLADSEADPHRMEPHADRAEIRQALREGWGESTRWSNTVSRDMKYVAVRVGPAERPAGVVRVSMPQRSIVARAREARYLLWKIAAIVLVAASGLALVLAWLWSGPIARITATARSLSKGDLSARAEVAGNDEIALLARSLNRMRDNLARQLETIDRQRRTSETLLAQLHEGVIVAGPSGRIVLLNPAAARLMDLSPAAGDGRGLAGFGVEDCVPQPELRRLLAPPASPASAADASAHSAVEEDRLTLRRPTGTVTLLARASDIVLPGLSEGEGARDPALHGRGNGAAKLAVVGRLLVLTDITELTRTLQVKTDFVANASHELRTPLSAIRGAVETLMTLDCATCEREPAGDLLRMIDRHSNRLEALVNDLLDLSRLESASARFTPAELFLPELVEEVRERFVERMAEKDLHWEQDFAAECSVVVNRELLALVLTNLVDNAVKFTDEGGTIRVSAAKPDGGFCVAVEDTGCGILAEEHDRVFERFYQVERARSGPSRGTGLGLSIVRHAVNAMKGSIELKSAPGAGTKITVTIPQVQ